MSYTSVDYRKKQARHRKRAFYIILGVVFFIGMLVGFVIGLSIQSNAIDLTNEDAPTVEVTSTPTIIFSQATGDNAWTSCTTEEITVPPETDNAPTYISLGTFKLTAYCPCTKCCGKWGENRPKDENGKPIVYTASGKIAEQGITIAADKSLLPFGTKVYINGHEYEVQDVGGSIKENRIDVYFEDHQEALIFGVQYAEVFIMGEEE